MDRVDRSVERPTRQTPDPKISVIVPALNEEKNLPYVFGRLPTGVSEVVLVDGGSVDRTVAVARDLRPSVTVVQQTRTGKGNALACGFKASTGDIIVMIDADGSTDPAEIPRFVEVLLDGYDFAKGSRFRPGGGSRDITRIRRLGNHGLNTVVNLLFGTRFTDLCYGYNAFWRHALPYLDLPDIDVAAPAGGTKLWGDGFEIETLINVRASHHGLRIREVPSFESERIHGVSNLNAVTDGLRVLRTIAYEYRRALREPARELTAPKPRPALPAAEDRRVGTTRSAPESRTAVRSGAVDGQMPARHTVPLGRVDLPPTRPGQSRRRRLTVEPVEG